MDRQIEITTLRTINSCPDIHSCPGMHQLADRPGRRYVILKKVTDPAEVAAFASRVADDEVLGWAPDELFEEV